MKFQNNVFTKSLSPILRFILITSLFIVIPSDISAQAEKRKPVRQYEFIVHLVKAMQLEALLPESPTIDDYIRLLESKGITIPGGYKPEEYITTKQMAIMLVPTMGLEKARFEEIKNKIRESYRDRAIIIDIKGDVKYKLKETKEWKEAKPGVILTAEDSVKTGRGAKLILRVGQVSIVTIKEDTVLTLYNLSKEPTLYIEKGEIILDTHGAEKETPYHVITPTTTTAVRGTILRKIVRRRITREICYKGRLLEYEFYPMYTYEEIIDMIISGTLDDVLTEGWVEVPAGYDYVEGEISPVPSDELDDIWAEAEEADIIAETDLDGEAAAEELIEEGIWDEGDRDAEPGDIDEEIDEYVTPPPEAPPAPPSPPSFPPGQGGLPPEEEEPEEEFPTPPTLPELTITTSSPLAEGGEGTDYSVTLSASGGTPPYTWSLVSGSLPNGLSFSSGGVISGTIAASGQQGTYTFTVQVTDSVGSTATKEFTLTVVYTAPTFSITQITNDSDDDYDPQIYDGKITWHGHDGNDYEIYYWDGSSITQITDNTNDDFFPQIYDGKITWFGSDGVDREIYYWDGSSTTQITNNANHDWYPQIYDGKITWYGSDGADNEIYYWDGASTTQITNNATDDRNPQIYDGKIAFSGTDGDGEVYYWDGASTTKITNNAIQDYRPQIYDGKIIWEGLDGDMEIYYWDGASITQITDNSGHDNLPQIYDGKITWYGHDGNDFEIYYWDGNSTTQITNNSTADSNPQIYDGKITWRGDDGNDYEIFYWDGTSTTQITSNSNDDQPPQIYDGKITWEGHDGNDYEIFLAERTAGSDPNITGKVYDSATGENIDSPITSIYPQNSTVATASTANNPYSFNVLHGYFYFRVEKEGYTFPSNNLNGVTAGDHGEAFYATGVRMTIDIPLDPGYPIEITKTANKRKVVVGDIVTYNIKIKNNSMWALDNIVIKDEITNGFKYVSRSAYIGTSECTVDSVQFTGRNPTFTVGSVSGYSVVNLSYQIRVGTGIADGEYKTTAVAWNTLRDWQMSNESSCKVEVVADALFTMGTIIGKVFNDKNGDGMQQEGEKGIPNVLIATEYGVLVKTDEDGKYHIPAVPPGNHLLKVDVSSVILNEVKDLDLSTRSFANAQDDSLRFTTENPYLVKVTEGLLAKVNFGITQPKAKGQRPKANSFFIVALAEGIVRNLDTSGNIDIVEQDDRFDEGIRVDGKLALYLKGKVKGKYLVTASFDTDRRPSRRGRSIRLRKLFTNLDPDKYYPVYGDASEISYEAADTQDELYLLVEWDKSHIKWGAFHTGIPLYNRTMQGASIVYESIKQTEFGDPYTKVTAFYARAYQVAAHDEFIGTGGSLYYLRHIPVIEGSEKVSVQLRDQVTKETIATAILIEERDYEIDYDTGRILLKKPLSSVNYNYEASIISNDILSGARAYLVVDYEYEAASSLRREAYGIKASQQIGNHIRVGGTYIEQEKANRYYKLVGGDGTIKLNKDTEVTAEYNRSEETQLSDSHSITGGLDFNVKSTTADNEKSGSAVIIKGKTKLFGNTDINASYTRQDNHFSATNTISAQGSSIYAGSIISRLKENLILGVKHTTQIVNEVVLAADLVGSNKVHTTTGLVDYKPGRWDFRLEYQHQNTEDPFIDFTYAGTRQLLDHDLIGGRIGYRFSDRFHPYIGGQGTIHGQVNNQGYIGADIQLWDATYINIKETVGNLGNSTLLGLTSQVTPDTEIYTNIEVGNNAQFGDRYTRSTYGQRTQLSPTSRVYVEHDYSSWQENLMRGNILGYEAEIGESLALGINYERAQIEKEPTAISRDTGSVTLSYLDVEKLHLFSKIEIREDRGSNTKRQWLIQNRALWYLTQDISLAGRANWSRTENHTTEETEAQFHEMGLGLAYRPVRFDRLNLLAKYSYITNHSPDSQIDFAQTTKDRRHIYALEGAFDITRYLQLVGKFAMRDLAEKVGPRDWTDSDTYLYIGRLNFHIAHQWDIAAEYRTLANRQIEDSRSGWLLEVDRELGKYIRLGVGYNFTDYDDDLANNDNYDASGWFVRVNGKY